MFSHLAEASFVERSAYRAIESNPNALVLELSQAKEVHLV